MLYVAVIAWGVVVGLLVFLLHKVDQVHTAVSGQAASAKVQNEVLAAEVARLVKSEILADARATAAGVAERSAERLADARVATAEAAAAPATGGPQEVVIVQPPESPVPVMPIDPPAAP